MNNWKLFVDKGSEGLQAWPLSTSVIPYQESILPNFFFANVEKIEDRPQGATTHKGAVRRC